MMDKHYREALKYLNESWSFVFIAFLIFVLSAVFGYVFSGHLVFIDDLLRDIILKFEGKGFFYTSVFIFQNNLMSSFFAIVFGIFISVFPIMNAVLNGLVMGYVLDRASEFGFLNIFLRLAPHGIFELPAIFISIGLGIKTGLFVFQKNTKKEFWRRFVGSVKVFLFVVLPLLLVAAIIEGSLIFFFG